MTGEPGLSEEPPSEELPSEELPSEELPSEEPPGGKPPDRPGRWTRRWIIAAAAVVVVVVVAAGLVWWINPWSTPSATVPPASTSPTVGAPGDPGTVYVLNERAANNKKSNNGTVSVIAPGATSVATTVEVGLAQEIAVAPPGTPEAGTVYTLNLDGTITTLAPGGASVTGTLRTMPKSKDASPVYMAIAPAGTPEAGTIYVTHQAPDANGYSGTGFVSVIKPGASKFHDIVTVGKGPGPLAIAPAGTPNAGTVYVTDCDSQSVSVIAPGAGKASSVSVGICPLGLEIMPAGTPEAGTVYVSNSTHNTISVIKPGAETSTPFKVVRHTSNFTIAPEGTPNAGTLYVFKGKIVSVIQPGATTVSSTITLTTKAPRRTAFAPAGTPNAGTLYATDLSGALSVIAPGDSTATTVDVGKGSANVVIAPAGTPNAGTAYIAIDKSLGKIAVLPPGATTISTTMDVQVRPFEMAIAPAPASATTSTTSSGN